MYGNEKAVTQPGGMPSSLIHAGQGQASSTNLAPPGPRIRQSAEKLENLVEALAKMLDYGHSQVIRIAGNVPTQGGPGRDSPEQAPSSDIARIEISLERLAILTHTATSQLIERLGSL